MMPQFAACGLRKASSAKPQAADVSSSLQHLIVPHAAWRIIRTMAIRQRRLRAGVLLGVVVLPPDRHRAVEADAIQLDEDLLQAVRVALRAGRDEVPAVGPVAHRSMSAQPAGPAVLARHPHALDVSAMDEIVELANELD